MLGSDDAKLLAEGLSYQGWQRTALSWAGQWPPVQLKELSKHKLHCSAWKQYPALKSCSVVLFTHRRKNRNKGVAWFLVKHVMEFLVGMGKSSQGWLLCP